MKLIIYDKMGDGSSKDDRQKRPGSEEINIIVIVSSGGCRSGATTKGESGAGLGELFHSGAEGLDVIVPEEEYNDLCFVLSLYNNFKLIISNSTNQRRA